MNDDCISREAVIEHICKSKECYKDECKGRLYKRCSSLQWVYDLPPVTPQQETGRWISHKEYCEKHDLIPSGLVTIEWCSNCDYGVDINERGWCRYNYCPHCGAKMEE